VSFLQFLFRVTSVYFALSFSSRLSFCLFQSSGESSVGLILSISLVDYTAVFVLFLIFVRSGSHCSNCNSPVSDRGCFFLWKCDFDSFLSFRILAFLVGFMPIYFAFVFLGIGLFGYKVRFKSENFYS
jgi:hypothetical protein